MYMYMYDVHVYVQYWKTLQITLLSNYNEYTIRLCSVETDNGKATCVHNNFGPNAL